MTPTVSRGTFGLIKALLQRTGKGSNRKAHRGLTIAPWAHAGDTREPISSRAQQDGAPHSGARRELVIRQPPSHHLGHRFETADENHAVTTHWEPSSNQL